MKLQNKKTGEIIDLTEGHICEINCGQCLALSPVAVLDKSYNYNSLAELNEEWEDYEEPKEYWSIDWSCCGVAECKYSNDDIDNFNKQIGNYFETEEEAEKAVEKLKAWKRLRDNGFEFTGWDRHPDFPGDFRITASDEYTCDDKDLDLLFGGEE